MGRKPNALILQHFERGAKLNDSSNRYEHTCKACGEKFPKGRIDSLSNHLTKKCPALSMQDRQKAALELNNLPHLPESARGDLLVNGQKMDLPIGHQSQENWSALSVLAEVSRQIDSKEKRLDEQKGGGPGEKGDKVASAGSGEAASAGTSKWDLTASKWKKVASDRAE